MTLVPKSQRPRDEHLRRCVLLPRGRVAFRRGLAALGMAEGGTILLPAYIGITDREGSGVFDPIRELGVHYDFYRLDDKLSPDLEDLAEKIERPSVEAVLAIHYFGFCQPGFDSVVELCQRHDVHLIEDCAHAFASTHEEGKLGTFGTFSFFSIHKFLPTADGGILRAGEGFPWAQADLEDDVAHDTLLLLYKSDIESIAETRRRNFEQLSDRLGEIHGLRPLYSGLPEGIVPLNCPVVIEARDRDEVYFALQERGVETVSLYYRLIPQIREADYPVSHELSRSILNLPIHQDIGPEEIDQLCRKLAEVLEG